jgi:hypothetical protein
MTTRAGKAGSGGLAVKPRKVELTGSIVGGQGYPERVKVTRTAPDSLKDGEQPGL